MQKIARRAADGANIAMSKLALGRIKHEDDLTGALAQAIEDRVNGAKTGGLIWDYSILTHRRSGEEGVYGADLLIHVKVDTPLYKYSKGVLIQSKRTSPGKNLKSAEFQELKQQCQRMQNYSAASFVFGYDPKGLRVAAATKIQGTMDRALYDQCTWTGYRFFLELFRCPIGDSKITSANVEELQPRYAIAISGIGDLDRRRLDLN